MRLAKCGGALLLAGALLTLGTGARAVPAHQGHEPSEAEASGQAPDGHGTGDHGDAHGGHGPGEINWIHGFLGEKDGVEPSLLWRPKGTPPPFGAMLLNTAILFYILGRFGGPKISQALGRRKATIMHGMDEAAKMKDEAASSLAQYEQKLARIDEDIERIKKGMREAGEAERMRVLAEAKERRARMERDAKLLIELELKAAHDELLRETVASAVRSAEDRLSKQVTVADQQRIAEHYLKSIGSSFGGKA
ncbi:MAG TPA: ATP synthase F0 subunit B [Polyangiaceae bacterium]